ncbi:toxin regulator [Neobacillus sp. 179-C4.2 HS]|uniref:Toxin regulator n=1 Tax=Neobacillus driksii TaxID=3035913 RepID=A0ABV4YYV7_9BACI|nr:toxin regulator [Neobacillus sp. 179.-C4.2 HS]MDP5194585.1 toxin regulator [Neobacillus sp. 179.-C4.2 HS]
MKVVLEFLKMRWKYVLTALIALSIGAAFGPSQEQVDSANAKVDEIKKQLSTKTETIASLETKNKDLQAKVDEAAPWFKMQDELKQKEAEAKAAEEKRLAEEKAKQEEEAAAKAKAEADAKAAEEAKMAQSGQQITADKVMEIINDYSYVVNNVSFKNGEINATIELAPMEQFSAKDLAVNEYSNLSDELLNHEGWQVLTVTYPGAGTISMNRNEKETNDYGDYFPTLKIEDRLK